MGGLSTNNGVPPADNRSKIEPAAGTAKIIHPDDDISLVSSIVFRLFFIKFDHFFEF